MYRVGKLQRSIAKTLPLLLILAFFQNVTASQPANAAGIACPTTTYLPNTSGNYPGDHGTNWATKNYLKSNDIYFKINKDSGEAIAVGYNNSVTTLVIPETITVTSQIIGAAGFDSSTNNCTAFAKEYKVRYIGTKAFASNGTAGKLLDSITINANIKSISEYAFEYQCRITSLVIPDSVTDIGESAFWKMDLLVDTNDACAGRGLQTVTLGINLLRVGFSAFQQDQQLTSVTFRGQVLRTTTSNNEMVYPSNYDLWNYADQFQTQRTNNLCTYIFAYANLSLNVLSGKGSDWRTWGTVGNCLNESSVMTQTITTPPSKIDAPVASNATQTTADVAFTASLNGGSPITGYRVTSVPGGVTATLSGATAGSVTVTGLSPGTNYKFFVVAINANGESSESELSNQITTSVLTVPAISLLPISETVTVGTAINGYVISNSGGATTSYSISPAISETPGLTFNNATGLISGTPTEIAAAKSYTISASNSAGLSSTNGTFTLTVNPRTISIANLPITAPVSGATPLSSLSSNGQYTTAITWNGSPTTFATSTVYTATATVTPVTNYTLTGVTANFFTVAGATSVSNSANAGVITAVFPATSTPTPPPVTPAVAEVYKYPEQTSSITSIAQGCPTDVNTVVIKGSFLAPIANIFINNQAINSSLWNQSATQVVITINAAGAKSLSIQIFNGQVPELATQTVEIATSCPVTPKPTPTPTPIVTNNPQPTPQMLKVGTVYMATGLYQLSPVAKKQLAAFAKTINKSAAKTILVYGHTDIRGGVNNTLLSQNRAKAVAAYLRPLLKLKKISIGWYASRKPASTGTSAADLALNRRVEIYTK